MPERNDVTARGAQQASDELEPVEPPEDHECPEDAPEGVIPKGDSAADRGWGPGWPANNSSHTTVVRTAGIAVSVRREIAPLVEWLLNQTLSGGYVLKHGECWGFANRAIRGTQQPSNHSWGLAVDLNAPSNPMTDRLITDMPDSMVALWKSKKFRWGGDYRNRKDPMHYEFMGTPDDARQLSTEVGGGAASTVTQGPSGGRPTLERGASGPDVRVLQERLNAHGAEVGVDGAFGPDTAEAVKGFQTSHGLTADGVVGPRTWAALDAAPPAAQDVSKAPPSLKRGASGADVRALQEKLNAHGTQLGVDGMFGPGTEQAVKAFQAAHGLTADGIAGPQTWAALG